MTRRTAACSCGAISAVCEGDPVRLSVCHCLECQRRTGSVFGTQVHYPREGVTVTGTSSTWTRSGDSGAAATFHFCLTCGSTVWWEPHGRPEVITLGVGSFADPAFPPPEHSVYEERRHDWVVFPEGMEIERLN